MYFLFDTRSHRLRFKTPMVLREPLEHSRSASRKRVRSIWRNCVDSSSGKLASPQTVSQVNEILHENLGPYHVMSHILVLGIMVLDVLIRHMPSMMYSTVGRSFFTPQDKRPLPNGAEVWQGYYQSARPGVGMCFRSDCKGCALTIV